MTFAEFLQNNIVCLDGGMGTLLQEKGLRAGEHPERWNISHPEVIREIHKSYYDAGSNVVCTNTFGANSLKFSDEELEEIVRAAIENARTARELSVSSEEKFIALDIGPTGKLLKPLGELEFEAAVEVFAKTVRLGVKYGAELILIETMNDSYETKAAVLAAKENSELPIIATNAYGEDGKLMTGADPASMVALLEGLGVSALGANCSLGPIQLRPVVSELLENASVPVVLKPNAGLPKSVNGITVFDVTPEEFSEEVADAVRRGVRVVGGCCGTTPAYIKKLKEAVRDISPVPTENKNICVVSSYTHAVKFGTEPVLIGERINPTGKKRLRAALLEGDMDHILTEAVNQQEKGVHVLDVNVGIPDINEVEVLTETVRELQTVTDLPLQIDTSDTVAMEAALRCYNGKPMINSVNGKRESMEAVFPIAKKYGGVIVALTLDENGIPETAEGRFEIAKRILDVASEYGIDKKNIIFDTLAMTVSADNKAAEVTLASLSRIKRELGCETSLGVSNVSFGLPARAAVNSIFFSLALENGLSAAIMNPYSAEMMKVYYVYRMLKGFDENCADYIRNADMFETVPAAPTEAPRNDGDGGESELRYAIIKGFKERAAELTARLLESEAPLEIVNREVIPALNTVGKGFEEKKVYLPQLLMSAEAAKSAFETVKVAMSDDRESSGKAVFVIATVKGDIHDIGKNIVKLLLENYGFEVVDLGKDVPPETVAETAVRLHAPFVGLSALMTTTVPAMEETVRLLKQKAPWCKTVVGGAVLTKEYADKIGADKYAADAMETVRYAETVIGGGEL